ncbi:GGDEF domain-containing protein [Zwartia sp.]|uniref:GGDEF domain-containing protein n=1 Tax=Zwartia sp. TaxID=2978004 RepID=UPI00271C00DF|nr:GGDEF domain-containing protein [Zwartia sp.]MDO9023949.1 GGDEF domain-containing protein [Zwartia sp.]
MSTTSQFIAILSGLTSAVMGILLLILTKKNTQHVDGLPQWTYGLLTLSEAIPLFLLRNIIPDFFSIVIANFLVLISFMLISKGLRNFFAVPLTYSKTFLAAFISVFLLGFLWFTYVDDSLHARGILFATGGLLVLLDGLWITLKHVRQSPGVIILALAISLLVVGRLIRMLSLILNADKPTMLFDDSLWHMVSLVAPHFAIPIATIAFVVLAYERLTLRLNTLLRLDELTDCLNKRAFYEETQREISRAIRYQHPTSFLMIDIDNFKSINDKLGHIQGDKILKHVADQIKQSLRITDMVSRFGGDEFVVILPETKITTAQKIAERIIETAAQNSISAFTVSVGLAALVDETDTVESVLSRADKALYKAKHAGKNQFALT